MEILQQINFQKTNLPEQLPDRQFPNKQQIANHKKDISKLKIKNKKLIKNFKLKIKNSVKGFSLVELLVVISIIAIISAFTLPNFMGARERARDSARITDMDSIKNALRLYYNDNQSYPVGNGGALGVGMSGYMPSIMNLGYSYDYYQSSNGDSFCLSLPLESGQGNEDIISQQKCGVGSGMVCGIGQTTDKLFVVCAN